MGTASDSTVPPPVRNIQTSGGACVHGAVYHTEIESSAYYGNWASDLENSGTATLC